MTRKKRPKELPIKLKKLQRTGDALDKLKKNSARSIKISSRNHFYLINLRPRSYSVTYSKDL